MKIIARLLSIGALALPLAGAQWQAIPREVWAMRDNPALVAQGAVILERKLDFQEFFFEQTIRVRILSQAGMAAVEFHDLPPVLGNLECQVTTADGRTQALGKRGDFLVRKVLSTSDGTVNEGVLVPPGVTPDCVVECRWREVTERGQPVNVRLTGGGKSLLPERYGNFCWWGLASAYPTRVCVVQRAKENYWPFLFLSVNDLRMTEATGLGGTSYTFYDIPGLPQAPFTNNASRPAPKLLFYRTIDAVHPLLAKGTTENYWQKVVDYYHKDYFLAKVAKGDGYKAFSLEMRKDLSGGPRDQARLIAERIGRRTLNLDQLCYDEKPAALARYEVDNVGVSNLDYAARTGYADNEGMVKLLLHILLDQGLPAKVAMVASRWQWMVNPEVRTPYQFTHFLIGVDEPGQATLWLDPSSRMAPAGELPHRYQGTKAVTLDGATGKIGFQEIKFAPAKSNTRSFTFRIEVGEDAAKVHIEVQASGAPALVARDLLRPKAPTAREAWFKDGLEKAGLSVTRVELRNALDPTLPLAYSVDASLPVESGRLLKINPFIGMDPGLYLPAAMPETRVDPIELPYLGILEAESTVTVPRGYLLAAPIARTRSTQWGTVTLEVRQDPGSGDLKARMRLSTLSAYNLASSYASLKDYLQWARNAVYPEVTLERGIVTGQ